MGYYLVSKKLFFKDECIPNAFALEKLGAGHDGFVFKYGDKVLKVLKYGIDGRKERGLMSFDKVKYFQNELNVKRITKPIDILLDEDGIYAGYVMNYYDDLTSSKNMGQPRYKNIGNFTCGDLISSVNELEDDIYELNRKKVIIKDVNRGSYIFSSDFLYLCDMDKYQLSNKDVIHLNLEQLNFIVAKLLYYEKLERCKINKEESKKISEWIRKACNSRNFLSDLKSDIGSDYSMPIKEYSDFVLKKVLN